MKTKNQGSYSFFYFSNATQKYHKLFVFLHTLDKQTNKAMNLTSFIFEFNCHIYIKKKKKSNCHHVHMKTFENSISNIA